MLVLFWGCPQSSKPSVNLRLRLFNLRLVSQNPFEFFRAWPGQSGFHSVSPKPCDEPILRYVRELRKAESFRA